MLCCKPQLEQALKCSCLYGLQKKALLRVVMVAGHREPDQVLSDRGDAPVGGFASSLENSLSYAIPVVCSCASAHLNIFQGTITGL